MSAMYVYHYILLCDCAGGIFTLFDGRIDKILEDTAVTNQICSHTDAVPAETGT